MLDVHAALDPSDTLALLRILFDTHEFYADRPSRRAAQKCLASVVASVTDTKLLAPFISTIRQEAQKPTTASSNAFVLVEWCALLLRGLVDTPLWTVYIADIIQTNAAALEKCLQPTTRSSLGRSALTITRRGLRSAFWYTEFRGQIILDFVQCLAAKEAHPTSCNAVMLGVIAGVCSRHDEAKKVLETQKKAYYTFISRELVGSRSPIPAHLVVGLRDFVSAFVTQDDLEKEIIPPVEKGLLRAPEVVLELLANVLALLPSESIDLSSSFAGHLLKPLLSNAKSSSPSTREGVLAVFQEAAKLSHDADVVGRIVEEVIGPLKSGKLATADQRVLHSNMLNALPMSTPGALLIATTLPVVTAKEGNEAALAAEASVLSRASSHLLRSDTELPKQAIEAFVSGLCDKKLPARRLWFLRIGDILLEPKPESQLVTSSSAKFAEAIVTPMVNCWTEAIKNPAAAVQSGLITGAYVFIALTLRSWAYLENATLQAKLMKLDVLGTCLARDPKNSPLLNHRVFGRLSNEDDFHWFLRSLEAVFVGIPQVPLEAQSTWSQALIHIVSSPSVSSHVRTTTCDTISKLYRQNAPLVSAVMIEGLWQWVTASDMMDKESVAAGAKFDRSYLHLVLRSICLNREEYASPRLGKGQDSIEKQMCELLILARDDLIPRSSWIDTCLRVGVDPGSLTRKFEQDLIDQLVEKTQLNQKVRYLLTLSPMSHDAHILC